MDIRGFALNIEDVLKEASAASNKFDRVALFARIWYLKALILEHNSFTITSEFEEMFLNALRNGCRSLQKALSLKPEDQLLKLVEEVPQFVESHFESSDPDSENLVSDVLYKFLIQSLLLKAEMLLSEFLKDGNEMKPLLSSLKKQMGALREGFIFLIKSEMNQTKQEDAADEMLALTEIEGLTAESISLCISCQADMITEESVKEMESQLSRLLRSLQDIKDMMEDLYFELPSSKFPQPSGSGSIRSLLERFKELHRRPHRSFEFATHQMEDIRDDLEHIMRKYSHIFSEGSGSSIHSQLVDHVQQVQRAMDKMHVESDPTAQQLLWLYHLSKKIKHVREEQLPHIIESAINTSADVLKTAPSRSSSSPWQHAEFIVGFGSEREAIIDRLLRKIKKLEVVLISGMPGAGKTTLAQTVFHNRRIQLHFYVRIWCSVTQAYQKRDLWLSILSQMEVEDDTLANKDDQDLFHQVSDLLSHKRYLIVLDDVWGTKAWQDLRSSFPDGANESRILMTSRLSNVVPSPLSLSRLSDEESWDLLTMKVFGHEGCPEELLELGQRIVKNCKGLPIAIIAVAGLLVKQNKNRWQQISEINSSEIFNDLIYQNADVFEQSYNHLRNHSKDCFRYLGVFPRDEDILVRRLLWLLIAEGFIENEEGKSGKSLEEIAEEYLTTLIDSSLVIAAKRGSNGKIKTCQVHGLVLDFCLLKATKAGFLEKISNATEFRNTEHYRLSICSDPEPFIAAKLDGPSVKSLLFFTSNEMYPGCDTDLSLIPENFRYLHVLDLESVNVGNTLAKGINHLPVLLRYLGVAGDMDSLPPSLSMLEHLETLVVKGLMNKFTLPAEIWKVTSLRHIHVSNHCLFILQNGEEDDGSDSKLDSLVSLSMPSFSFVEETKNIFTRLPNIRKLKCVLLEPRVGSNHVRQFPEFRMLEQLESLRLSYSGRPFYPMEWRLPSGLKELNLSNFRLPWDQISALIKVLPNLKILKLVSRAFEGTTWEMSEGEFKSLVYLKLDSLNLVHWNADDDQLPNLEHLVLRNCEQLQHVPPSFGGTETLKKIEVRRCRSSVEEAVRNFVEEQLEFGNNDLISDIS